MEVIRPIEMKDLSDLMDLGEEAFGDDRRSLNDYAVYASQGYQGLVLVDTGKESTDKRMRGTTWFGPHEDWIEIATLAVFSQYRGRGYARRLLRRALFLCEGNKFFLNVRLDNAAAIKLYESEGFVKVAEIPAYYLDGAPAYRMEKLPQS